VTENISMADIEEKFVSLEDYERLEKKFYVLLSHLKLEEVFCDHPALKARQNSADPSTQHHHSRFCPDCLGSGRTYQTVSH
jgi:hypothetical protein